MGEVALPEMTDMMALDCALASDAAVEVERPEMMVLNCPFASEVSDEVVNSASPKRVLERAAESGLPWYVMPGVSSYDQSEHARGRATGSAEPQYVSVSITGGIGSTNEISGHPSEIISMCQKVVMDKTKPQYVPVNSAGDISNVDEII